MEDMFPEVLPYRLGDAEFVLLKTGPAKQEDRDSDAHSLHCHRYFEVHCTVAHQRDLALSTQTISLEANQLLLICPGCMHYSSPYADSRNVLSFELRQGKGERGFYRHFMELFHLLNLTPLPLSRKLRHALLDFSSAELQNTVMAFCRLKLLGLTVLVAFLENLAPHAEHRDSAYTPEHTGAFDAALDMMLYSDLTLEQIARQLGYSSRHTARLIHRRYGNSLGRIRRNIKNKQMEKDGAT